MTRGRWLVVILGALTLSACRSGQKLDQHAQAPPPPTEIVDAADADDPSRVSAANTTISAPQTPLPRPDLTQRGKNPHQQQAQTAAFTPATDEQRQVQLTSHGNQYIPGSPMGDLPVEAYTGQPGDGETVPGLGPDDGVPPTGDGATLETPRSPTALPRSSTVPGVVPHLPGAGGYHPALGCDPNACYSQPTPGCGPSACPPSSCPTGFGPQCVVEGNQPWVPPGIGRPWPRDEYVCDGGDREAEVVVNKDFTIRGLDLEDAVVHYDTLDGRRLVDPSNRVCIYAPRFAAVRKVTGVFQHDQQLRMAQFGKPERLGSQDEYQVATTTIQPVQPGRQVGRRSADIFRETLRGVGVDNADALAGMTNDVMPHEDFRIVKAGVLDHAEKARLAEATQAAVAWSHDQMVQVLVGKTLLQIDTADLTPGDVYRYQLPPGKHRLDLVKTASAKTAKPGETVHFTLRFDNRGDQPVGNVTIVDNLSARLEYVPGTAQCSIDADFFVEENEGESLVLRWEVHDPLEVGQGGVIRFQCKVR